MNVTPIKTRVLLPPKDDLFDVIQKSIPSLKERTIIAITSKVVSIWQGRCIPISRVQNKDDLIISEADLYLPRNLTPHGWAMHTLKNNLLIPSAGIDESNGNGYYILWPRNPAATAKKIGQFLQKAYRVKNVGVIITDSHSIPLRGGVIGISLGAWGFNPLNDYRDTPDIFGRPFHVSQTNVPDTLASAAVFTMGEGTEQTPIAIISDIPSVHFTSNLKRQTKNFSSLIIPMANDLYKPFLTSVPWRKGKKRRRKNHK
jgi:putative folate metabolism gamma-glutamate ligase